MTRKLKKYNNQREVSMRKIKEILRLHYANDLSQRQIASSLNISVGVVNKYLKLSEEAGITWPLPDDLREEQLIHKLYQSKAQDKESKEYAAIDKVYINQELKRKHMTLQLLWEEYCENNAGSNCYSYSQYCKIYRDWQKRQNPVMRQTHKAGDKLFIDYAGDTVAITDSATGEVKQAQIFVAAMGASNYVYAEATWTQQLPDWISSHVRMFNFYGGVPKLLIPDNLKSSTTKACIYEPDMNRTYADLVEHYNTAVLPARPVKPKDKAKVETSVLIVERWILARLRNHKFFSLFELNNEIKKLLKDLNNRPLQKLGVSRRHQYETLDLPVLGLLPQQPYEFAEFKIARVNMDYHIEISKHYYSVPYQLLRQEVEVRITRNLIEVFNKNKKIAVHKRSFKIGSHTTNPAHMPKAHQKHAGWTPGYFLNRAIKIGKNTKDVVKHIIEHKKHPEQSYRACLGILRLEKRFSANRLEDACKYALSVGAIRRRSIVSILDKGLDKQTTDEADEEEIAEQKNQQNQHHENIRGSEYYDKTNKNYDKTNTGD